MKADKRRTEQEGTPRREGAKTPRLKTRVDMKSKRDYEKLVAGGSAMKVQKMMTPRVNRSIMIETPLPEFSP